MTSIDAMMKWHGMRWMKRQLAVPIQRIFGACPSLKSLKKSGLLAVILADLADFRMVADHVD